MQDKKPDLTTERAGFRAHVGYRTTVWREGYAEVEIDVGEPHLNMQGRLHGGVQATLLDAAMGRAVAWCSVAGNVRRAVTVSLTTHFLATARLGETVVARARVVSIDGRIAMLEGEVVGPEDRLMGKGQGTFSYAPGSERVEGVPRHAR